MQTATGNGLWDVELETGGRERERKRDNERTRERERDRSEIYFEDEGGG